MSVYEVQGGFDEDEGVLDQLDLWALIEGGAQGQGLYHTGHATAQGLTAQPLLISCTGSTHISTHATTHTKTRTHTHTRAHTHTHTHTTHTHTHTHHTETDIVHTHTHTHTH